MCTYSFFHCFRSLFYVFIILIILSSTPVFAVSETSLMSLLISPSAQANAMGQVYSPVFASDPMAGIFNPASVGLSAQDYYGGSGFYSQNTYWLPDLTSQLTYDAHAIHLGMNLDPILRFPLALGMGYHHVKLDFGREIFRRDDSPDLIYGPQMYEKANGITLALALDYYIRTSFGFSYKFLESQFGVYTGEPNRIREIKVSPTAHDWGLIVQFPLIDIFRKLTDFSTDIEPGFGPFLEPGLFFARNNIGGKVVYIDESQAEPLPRNAYAGLSFLTGLLYHKDDFRVKVFSFSYAQEAQDLLVERHYDGRFDYRDGLADINFFRNVLLGKGNANIIKMKGWQIGFYDTFFLRGGRYEDVEGAGTHRTDGWGLNFARPIQILHGLKMIRTRHWLSRLLLHLDVEYHYCKWDLNDHPLDKTQFKNFIIRLNNFPLTLH